MMDCVYLTPASHHAFNLHTVEKLHERHLKDTGAYLRPEQIPLFVERVRHNIRRVEEALLYRLECQAQKSQGEEEPLLLSKFERVRVGQILADVVLDIAAVSIASRSGTCDVVVNTNTAFPFSTCHVCATPTDPNKTEESLDHHEFQQQQHESMPMFSATEVTPELSEGAPLLPTCGGGGGGSDGGSDMSLTLLGRSAGSPMGCLQSIRSMSSVGDRLQQVRNQPYSYNVVPSFDSRGESSNSRPTQAPSFFHDAPSHQQPSYGERLLSPVSMRFKPVLSMHSGADSSTVCPTYHRRPRKYYDIDLQKLSDFTHCLRMLQQINFTDMDFEMIGLRYAIPGIRELDPKEVRFLLERVDERRHPHRDFCTLPREDNFAKRSYSLATTAGGSETDARSFCFKQKETKFGFTNSFPIATQMQFLEHEFSNPTHMFSSQSSAHQEVKGRGTPTEKPGLFLQHSPPPQSAPPREQCLPLFRGGKDIIVQKKDLPIFLAVVEVCLKRVDQEVDGRLRAAGADLASSSGEEEVHCTA